MVKIEFDRLGIDTDWALSHKHSEISPEEHIPNGVLDDVPMEDVVPIATVSPQDDQEDQKFASPSAVQGQEQNVVNEGEAVESETCGQEHNLQFASTASHSPPLDMEEKPETEDPEGLRSQTQLETHGQPASGPRFLSCFSWFASLMQPMQPAVQGQDSTQTDNLQSDLQRALQESASLHEASQVSIAEGRSRLQSVMEAYNAKPRAVEADGNCQFRALSQQLHGDEGQHKSIRARMVEQLQRNPETYEGFVHEPFGDYISRISRDGEWGDNVTLQAASDMLGIDIHVLTDQPGAEHLEVQPAAKNINQPQAPLWLAFLAEVHYDSVELL